MLTGEGFQPYWTTHTLTSDALNVVTTPRRAMHTDQRKPTMIKLPRLSDSRLLNRINSAATIEDLRPLIEEVWRRIFGRAIKAAA